MDSTITNGIFLVLGVLIGGVISIITGFMSSKSQKEQLRAQFQYQSKVKWLADLTSCIVKLRNALDSYVNLKLQIHFIRTNIITAAYNLMDLSEALKNAKEYFDAIDILAGEYSILLSEDSQEAKSLKEDLRPFITEIKQLNLNDSNVVSNYSERLRLYTDRVENFILAEKNKLNSII